MLSDLKYALRQLRKNPGFTLVAVLILAVGIGTNTSIFSLVDATLLRALPVRDPDRLVVLSWNNHLWPPKLNSTGNAPFAFSYSAFERLRGVRRGVEGLFAFAPIGSDAQSATVVIDGEATTANGLMVSGGYFSGLGVNLLLGRGITDTDEPRGAPRTAVISYGYWTRRFNRDPAVVGRTLAVNNLPFTIVGVAPPSFHGVMPPLGADTDLWIAFADLPNLRPWGCRPPRAPSFYADRHWACLSVAARLDPSVPRVQSAAELDSAFRAFLTSDWKPRNPGQVPHLRLVGGGRGLAGLRDILAPKMAVLMAAVGMLLLVACANLATLLLARAGGRRREVSIRLALGASRSRIVRQLLTESILLSCAGGAAGVLLAEAGTRALAGIVSNGQFSIGIELAVDSKALLFACATSMVTAVLFGLAPALSATRVGLASAMRESSRGSSDSPGRHRLGNALVVAQISISAALVVAAGLFVRTLSDMENRDLGFQRSRMLVFGLDPTRIGYQGARLADLYARLQSGIRSLPSVQSATLYEYLPFLGWSNNTPFTIVGLNRKVPNKIVRWATVGPDFCRTLRISLRSGRDIRDSDTATSPKVALVNELFARRFLGSENPIGRLFTGPDGKTPYEIVGVFRDVEIADLHAPPLPKAFLPYTQVPGWLTTMYFDVRAKGDAAALPAELRAAVRRVDPRLPLLDLSTLSDWAEIGMLQERVFADLAGIFGAAALSLACIGLYGTMAYAVSRRTREIGIRIALGAAPRSVLGMVLGQGLGLAALGVLLGFILSLGLARAVRSLLYGITATDPATFVAAAILMAAVAFFACWLPARRATKVDPITALRAE